MRSEPSVESRAVAAIAQKFSEPLVLVELAFVQPHPRHADLPNDELCCAGIDPAGAAYYVRTVDGELAVHLAVSSMNKGGGVEARACRLVTMPEWQGAGVGFRFLNHICEMQAHGDENARLAGRKTTTVFHTSHPQSVSGAPS